MSSFAFILSFWLIGESIVQGLGVPFPGSVLGMVLLFLFLIFGWIKFEYVEEASLFFRKNLTLFFIPAGVLGLKYFGLLKEDGPALVVSACVSSVILMTVSGKMIK